MITNLISNAVKYSPNGGEVKITCVKVEESIKISVRDSGIGIPEQLQHKVFDRFFRANNVQSNLFPGVGLELYITAGIIKHHGGSISVKSKPNEGSEFSFIIPLMHKNNN